MSSIAASGSVGLVGAGPGDPDLLTMQGVKAIRRATVLRYARRGAPIVHVGKRGGCRSTPQSFIHKLMAPAARRGKTVVRLKGGDPLVFGRGGEKAEHLRAAGIAVRVVNGISSGLAAVTAQGVRWTHHDHAHGVLLVTGHSGHAQAELDWPTLAAAAAQGLTLVVYMAMQRLAAIQAGLLGTLGRLVDDAAARQMRSPCILIAGNVLTTVRARGVGADVSERVPEPTVPPRARSEA